MMRGMPAALLAARGVCVLQVLANGELLSAQAAQGVAPPGVDLADGKRPSVLLVGNPSLPLKVCPAIQNA